MDPQTHIPDRGDSPIHPILAGIVWVGRAAAWLIVPIFVIVLISVVLSASKIGVIMRWENDVFVLG